VSLNPFAWVLCYTCIFQVSVSLGTSHGTSLDALAELFRRIEEFFRRLETYTMIPPTPEMKEVVVKVMAEVLSVLAIATKELEQRNPSELITCDGRPPLAYGF
jgi:hypothetical protein